MPNLLIQQVVSLVDETDRDVCDNFARPSLTELAKMLVSHVRVATNPPDKKCLTAVFGPDPELPCAKEVVIIAQEFIETSTSNSGQFELCLFRSP
jgi:hypothetical protein